MKRTDLNKLAISLQEDWESYRYENDWGSGEDRIQITFEIEKEYYEDRCFDLGLTENETQSVLEYIGF